MRLGEYWLEAGRSRTEAASVAEFVARRAATEARIEAIFERPIHDPGPDLAVVRRQLRSAAQGLGLDRRGSAHPQARRALGRLFLATGDARTAVAFFDSVWRQGAIDAESAALRSRAHGELLAQGLSVPGLEDGAVWGGAQEATSLRALVESLEQVPGGGSEVLLRGLQAWQGKKRLQALDALEEAIGRRSDPEPGPLPQSRFMLVLARWAQALDRAEASRTLALRAEGLLEAELAARPSDWRLHSARCAARLHLLVLDAGSRPAAVRFAQAEAACQDGLMTRPESVPLLVGLAHADLLHAEHRLRQGLAAMPFIRAAKTTASKALAIDPNHRVARRRVAQADALLAGAR